ncbi:MAG: histidine--tRNA ligase, partial [Dehalococcoidia bacterium]
VLAGAPSIFDHLCDACRSHWERLCHGLDILGISYQIDHRLVRGLDYYVRTAFEFLPAAGGAQSVLGGGGRYDGLSESISGPPVPGVGFGCGLERLILNIEEAGVDTSEPARAAVYVAHVGDCADDAALLLASTLRKADVPTDMAFGTRSLRAQMRQANGSRASFAAIIGEDEVNENQVTLRSLASGEQECVPFEAAVQAVTDGVRREAGAV